MDTKDLRLPPHNIDAEKWVIGSVLLDNDVMHNVEALSLKPEDFYQPEHQSIYKAVQNLYHEHKRIDVITVSDELKKEWELEKVWGTDYINELAVFVVSPSLAYDYAKIVKEKSVLRRILKVSQDIIGQVYEEKDVRDILDTIESKIFNLTQVDFFDSMRHIREILDMRADDYMRLAQDPDSLTRWKVNTGFKTIDDFLGGFKPWELIILAARPSMGKTSFALNVAANAAVKYKKSVAVFSLEMGSEQIADRILSLEAEVPLTKITKWQLDDNDFEKIWAAMTKLGEADIHIDDRWWATVAEVRSKLRRLKIEKGKLDFVVIDYLQLMHSPNIKLAWNRVQEIWEISRGLKELARELNVPILALSQLSRAVESRADKKPQLSDLRESGAIEQDADTVLMLFREDYYDSDTERKGIADIFVRKNRNWPTWELALRFEKSIMKFFDLAPEEGFLDS